MIEDFDKYQALNAIRVSREILQDYIISFDWDNDTKFEKITDEIIKKHGVLDRDIYYIGGVGDDTSEFAKLKDNQIIPFGEHTELVKRGDEERHHYFYRSKVVLIFGKHKHKTFAERLKPLNNNIILYLFIDGKIKKVMVKKGEEYIIPANIWHLVYFPKPNEIELDWVKEER